MRTAITFAAWSYFVQHVPYEPGLGIAITGTILIAIVCDLQEVFRKNV